MVISDFLLSIIYPKRCMGCRKMGRFFCDGCIKQIDATTMFPICPICTKPAVGGVTHPYCLTRNSMDGFVGVFRYTKGVRKAIQTIKFRRSYAISQELINLSFKTITVNQLGHYTSLLQFIIKYHPTIIPIPLHWKRKKKRWFNQSEVFGIRFAQDFNLQINTKLLTRTKYTTPQVYLDRKKRLVNVAGSFAVNSDNRLLNTDYIVVDDVWTTGATLREAGSVLKKNGAKKVWGLTVAR